VTPPHSDAIRNPVKTREVSVYERNQLEAGDFPQRRKMATLDSQPTPNYGQPQGFGAFGRWLVHCFRRKPKTLRNAASESRFSADPGWLGATA